MKKSSYWIFWVFIPFIFSCDNSPSEDGQSFIKYFGGSFNQKAFAFEEAPDGNIIIVGSSSSFKGSSQVPHIFVIKTDPNGNRISQKIYESKDSLAVQEGKALTVLDNGEILILAYTQLSPTSSKFYLLKLNSDLDTLQTRSYGVLVSPDEKLYLKPTSDQGFVLLGTSPEPQNNNKKDMVLLKVNTNLDSVYTRRYGLFEKDDIAGSLLIENENIVWCGTANRRTDDSDLRVLKADSSGELSWSFDFEETSGNKESGRDIQKVADEKYIVVGSRMAADQEDIYIVELEVGADGFLKNTPRSTSLALSDGQAVGRSIYPTADGGFAVAGSFVKEGNPSSFLLKLTENLEIDTSWPVNPRLFGGDADASNTSLCEKDQGELVKQLSDGSYLILNTICFEFNSVIALIKTDRQGRLF